MTIASAPIASAPIASSGSTAQGQIARPYLDISTGTWTNELGGSTLYASIDEATRNDADYIQSSTVSGGSDTCEVKLDAIIDPGTDSGHAVYYAAKMTGTGTLTVTLLQGATPIASWSDTLTGSYQEFSHALSTGEASGISDYSNLRLRFVASNP